MAARLTSSRHRRHGFFYQYGSLNASSSPPSPTPALAPSSPPPPRLSTPPTMLEPASNALLEGLVQAYRDGTLTDVEIICESASWKVHKLILVSQSEYFRKALTGDFKEAKEGRITLEGDPDFAGTVLDGMIEFLYTRNYENADASMIYDVCLFVVADKHLIAPLKDLATEKLTCKSAQNWYEPYFKDVILEMYDQGACVSSMLNKAVLPTIIKHIEQYHAEREKYAWFHDAMKTIPGFAQDVTAALTKIIGPVKEFMESTKDHYRCPTCGTVFQIIALTDTARDNMCCTNKCNYHSRKWYWSGFRASTIV